MTVADTYGAKLWLTLDIRWRIPADLPVQQRETAACVGRYEGTAGFLGRRIPEPTLRPGCRPRARRARTVVGGKTMYEG